MRFFDRIHIFFTNGDHRSIVIKKNIAGSFVLRIISIIISLQVVPLTINYINPSQYGVWLTISSIIAWLGYFDLGFAHGFRNSFAEAIAKNDFTLAKKYVSTTYAVLFILFGLILAISLLINCHLDWNRILNITSLPNHELQMTFGLLVCFFCLNIIASVFTTMLTAEQKPALASLIQTGGQFFAFICIYILTKTVPGNLIVLAFAFSGIPCLLLIIVSICTFCQAQYRIYAPSFKFIQFSLTKNIVMLGGQFFLIMISMLFIFQFINIILSRIEGPVAVTQYNITYKYFNTLNMLAIIILSPFWSAFTDAYIKHDYNWMRRVVGKLEKLWLFCIPLLIIMVCCSNIFYKLWIRDAVQIPLSLSICVSLYVLFQIAGNLYMYMINGTSKVRLQMIVYLLMAAGSIPLMNLCCKKYGIEGILIIPTITFLLQAIIGRIQIYKLINCKASGIFNK